MPRVHRCEYGVDTGMFSVHQIHPEAALRLAFSTVVGGLAKHGRSLQSMIEKCGTSLLVMGADVEYKRKLTFFSAPFVVAETSVGLRDDGRLLLFQTRHFVADEEAIVVRFSARPVKLTGGPGSDVFPGPLDPELRELFDPDEFVPRGSVPTRGLETEVARWATDAEKIGEDRWPLFIGRDDCEFADQLVFTRLPSIVASAREQLLLEGADYLSTSASRPLTAFHGEFFRPMFFGDRGRIETETHQKGDQIVAVHRVLGPPVSGAVGPSGGDWPLCALAVEIF